MPLAGTPMHAFRQHDKGTPMHFAAIAGDVDSLYALAEYGANATAETLVSLRPGLWSVSNGQGPCLCVHAESLTLLPRLRAQHPRPLTRVTCTQYHKTPLEYAVIKHHDDAAEWLEAFIAHKEQADLADDGGDDKSAAHGTGAAAEASLAAADDLASSVELRRAVVPEPVVLRGDDGRGVAASTADAPAHAPRHGGSPPSRAHEGAAEHTDAAVIV